MSETVNRLVVAIAARPHGHPLAQRDEPLDDLQFGELLRILQHHRLTGALAEAAEEGVVHLPDPQRRMLSDRHARWSAHCLRLEQLLGLVWPLLTDSGIDVRVLKGAALARLVYSDPAWRLFGDIDLLLPSDRFDEAVRLVTQELGGQPAVAELRPGFDREFGKDATMRIGQLEADLHRTFVLGPFGLTIPLDSLFTGHTDFSIGSAAYRGLGPKELFLHACYEAALGDYPPRLVALRDLFFVHTAMAVDTGEVLETARRWRATAVVRRAARLTADLFGLAESHDLRRLGCIEVPRQEAWLVRSYLTPALSYTRPLASLAVIPGLRARARYTRALVAPSRAYLRSRGWTEAGHLQRALTRLVAR